MNIWYISSLSIIGLGTVILIACFLGSIFGIRKISNVLNAKLQRIEQQQVQPLLTQLNLLSVTVNRLVIDVKLKKADVVEITDRFKDLGRNVNQLTTSTRISTKKLVDKVNTDPQMQAQTEQWIRIAMSYLKRKSY